MSPIINRFWDGDERIPGFHNDRHRQVHTVVTTSGGESRHGQRPCPITAEEIRVAEGVMLYHPDSETRDHIGRPGDQKILETMLEVFAEMLDELRRAGHVNGGAAR